MKLERPLVLSLSVAVPIVFGALSIGFRRSVDWDLMNYHYYNPYAFLNDRLGFDIAPAQLQSYFNPLVDIPFYWLAKSLPAMAVAFVMGAIQGLNFSMVFLVFWAMTPLTSRRVRIVTGFAVATAACLSPGFGWSLGRTGNSNIVSLFILGSLLALLTALRRSESGRQRQAIVWTAGAGVLMGSAVGLRLPALFYALAGVPALLVGLRSWRRRIAAVGVYGVAGIAGGLAALGHWMWVLWREFANPFFPMFNDIFHSPAAPALRFSGNRFSPDSLWEYLTWPVLFSVDLNRVWERTGMDARFGILYILAIACVTRRIWQRDRQPERRVDRSDRRRAENALLGFFFFAFVLWMALFSIYRYALTLELLVPLCFVILLDRLGLTTRVKSWSIGLAAAWVAAVMSANGIQHGGISALIGGRVSWTDRYIEVASAPFDSLRNAIVVMLGNAPFSFVIPELPAEIRFLRREGNLELYKGGELGDRVERAVRTHSGPIFLMFPDHPDYPIDPLRGATSLGLEYDEDRCFMLDHNRRHFPIKVCRVQ